MEIFIEKLNKTIEYKVVDKILIKEIMKELNLSNEDVIILKNDKIVLDMDHVIDSDKLKMLTIISGG